MHFYINKKFCVSIICVLSLFIYRLPGSLDSNNTVYALEHINMYDANLFANNIAVTENNFSPRFFMNVLVSTIMKLNGGDWTAAAVLLMYFAAIVLALATVKIVFNLTNRNEFIYSLILGFFLSYNVNNFFPGWGSFELKSLGLGTAYTFVMLALSYVIGDNKNWNKSLILLAVATLLHIHEGMWGFSLIFVLFLYDAIVNKTFSYDKIKIGFPVFVIVMLICIAPAFIGAKSTITHEQFKHIYIGRVRHHVFPHGWGYGYIFKYFLLILFGAIIRLQTLYYLDKANYKKFFLESGLFIFSWVIALLIAHIFTHIWVIPAIVTMYTTKYLKYVAIMSVIWYLKNIIKWSNEGEKLIATTLFLSACMFSTLSLGYSIIAHLLFIFFIILYKGYNLKFVKILLALIPFGILTYFHMSYFYFYLSIYLFVMSFIFLNENKIAKKIASNILVLVIFLLSVFVYSTRNKIWVNNGKIRLVTYEEYIIRSVGNEFYNLAKVFEKKTNVNDVFVGNPFNRDFTAWFQLISKRNTFSSWKILPSDLNKLLIWNNDIRKSFEIFKPNANKPEIKKFLVENNLKYILSKSDEFKIFDNDQDFKIFAKNGNDSYRIYEFEKNIL